MTGPTAATITPSGCSPGTTPPAAGMNTPPAASYPLRGPH
jgi:hypothetical protein